MKRLDKELVGLKLHLNVEMGFLNDWIDKIVVWLKGSLKQFSSDLKASLNKKFLFLRKQRDEKQNTKVKKKRKLGTKVVYNNSSKKLTDEQIELLLLGLIFEINIK